MTTIYRFTVKQDQEVRNFIDVHMRNYPFIFSNERKYRIRRHVAFWLFWGSFQGILYSFLAANSFMVYVQRLPVAMLESFIFLVGHMFLAYTLMYFVVPRFLLKQKYWKTGAWTLVCFFLTACIATAISWYIIDPLRIMIFGEEYARSEYRMSTVSLHLSLLAGLRGGITVGGIAAAIKLMKHWYVKEQRNLQLQKENVEAQLQLLKAQVHPHFLFNTMNNIYSFTQNTSPEAAKMITDLSAILRFMLYECNQRVVPLSKELQMIRDYISLEQIRYGNKLDIHIDLPENTNDLYVAPLLLLPLVENCFKHGASTMLDQPWVSLQVELIGKEMRMKLINGKASREKDSQAPKGIGIENVKRRLDLIYSGKYELQITDDTDVFIVNLKVELEQVREQIIRTTAEPAREYA